MSSTTNTPYMTKSMNGVIVISDGAGTVIEDGSITTNNFDATNFNTNNIQGLTTTDNITLYTNTTGSIDIGQLSTSTLNLKSINTNINASTLNLSSNILKIGGAQTIEQTDTAADFYIGGNVTTRNFYLGNLTAPPQVPFVATQAFDVVNYDTCVTLIGGGGTGQLYADDIYTFTPGAFTSLWTDNTAGIVIGPNVIANTAYLSMANNNGALALGTITNRSADTYIATGTSNSGNIYIGSGQSTTGDIYIASNNYLGTTGATTSNVFIGGSSTATRFNGTVSICAYSPAAGINNITIGSDKSVHTLKGSALKLNSTNTTINTVALGSVQSSTNSLLGTALYLNSSNTTTNTVALGSQTSTTNTLTGTTLYLNNTNGVSNINYLGGSNTTITDIKGANININSTYLVAGNTINIGNNLATIEAKALTMNLNSNNVSVNTINLGGSVSIINAYPITPSSGITYNATTGTNIVGTIGYVYRGSFSGGSLPSSSLQQIGSIASVPAGVYYVSASVAVDCTVAGQIQHQQYSLDTGNSVVTFAITGTGTGTAPGNCLVRIYYGNVSGVICLTTTTSLFVRVFWQYSGGTFARSGNSFQFTAVRIA
jgi:hypothetical protein